MNEAMRTDAGNVLLNYLRQERIKTGREAGNHEKESKIDLPWAFMSLYEMCQKGL